MIIKSSTWNRDSWELYDYENDSYNNNTHYVTKNSYLIRTGNNTEITNKYNPKLKENYLLNIICEDKEHFIQKNLENNFTKEKVWISLRYYNSQKFDQVYLFFFSIIFKKLYTIILAIII